MDGYINVYEKEEYKTPLGQYIRIKDRANEAQWDREYKEYIKKKEKEEKRKKELAKKKKIEKAKKEKEKSAEKKKENGEWMNFTFTFYTAFCNTGCIGKTKNGTDVSNTIYSQKGRRVVAADPSVIPLNSIIVVQYDNVQFEAIVADTGGAIKGKILDILVDSKSEANILGRKQGKVRIIRRGE